MKGGQRQTLRKDKGTQRTEFLGSVCQKSYRELYSLWRLHHDLDPSHYIVPERLGFLSMLCGICSIGRPQGSVLV